MRRVCAYWEGRPRRKILRKTFATDISGTNSLLFVVVFALLISRARFG
jgi:hypothetical protein